MNVVCVFVLFVAFCCVQFYVFSSGYQLGQTEGRWGRDPLSTVSAQFSRIRQWSFPWWLLYCLLGLTILYTLLTIGMFLVHPLQVLCQLFFWIIRGWLGLNRFFLKEAAAWSKLHYDRPVRIPLNGHYSPEAMMPGSELLTLPAPEYQGAIYSGGGSTPVGHGVRMGNYLVVPTHVISYPDLTVRYTVDGQVFLSDLPSGFQEVYPDISVLKLNAQCKLKSAKVANPMETSAFVAHSVLKGASSVGKLQIDGFEGLRYTGSTIAGNSGCAYAQGKHLVGIHLGSGGGVNMGVSAAYVSFLLEKLEYTKESSDYVYLSKLSAKQLRELNFHETGDPDEVEVKYQGKYYRLTRHESNQLKEFEDKIADAQFEDYMARVEGDDREQVVSARHVAQLRDELKQLRKQMRFESAPPDPIQELRAEVAALRVAVARLHAPSAPLPDQSVDPVKQYDPENFWRAPVYGKLSNQEPRIVCPEANPQSAMPCALDLGKLASDGRQQTQLQSIAASPSTQGSVSNSDQSALRRQNNDCSKIITGKDIHSIINSPASTSGLKVAPSGSTKLYPDLTSQQEQASGISDLITRLDKLLAGMASDAATKATSRSSKKSSAKRSGS